MMYEGPVSPPQPTHEDFGAAVSMIGRLRPGNAVGEAVVSLLRAEPVPLRPLIAALLAPLASRWRERELAAWALGYAPADAQERDAAFNILLDVLEGMRRERAWRVLGRVILRTYVGMFPPCFFLSLLVMLLSGTRCPEPWPVFLLGNLWILCVRGRFARTERARHSGGGPAGRGGPALRAMAVPGTFFREIPLEMFLVMGTGALPAVVPASLLYDRTLTNRVRAMAARSLGRLGLPDSIGALAAAVWDRSPRVREAAAEALHGVLPTLTDAHFGLLGAQSVANMGRALTHGDTQLVFKLLEALEHVRLGAHPRSILWMGIDETSSRSDHAARVSECPDDSITDLAGTEDNGWAMSTWFTNGATISTKLRPSTIPTMTNDPLDTVESSRIRWGELLKLSGTLVHEHHHARKQSIWEFGKKTRAENEMPAYTAEIRYYRSMLNTFKAPWQQQAINNRIDNAVKMIDNYRNGTAN